MSSQIKIFTKINDHPYLVIIGKGVKNFLLETILEASNHKPEKIAVVSSSNAGVETDIDPANSKGNFSIGNFLVDDTEESKNLSQVERLCGEFSNFQLNRSDLVVAVGGGLVSDLAGFAAGIYHRGMPVVYVPTTLLACVDASIGGKTGVNLKQGKNLVGAFHHPSAVLMDTNFLKTLPEEEIKSGMGEIAKYHFLVDHLEGLEDYFEKLGLSELNPKKMDEMELEEKIACCVGIKLFVVSSDEKESGIRALLNYGHTLGHALEVAGSFNLRHGEAVAIGIIFAAELAHILGRIDESRVEHHRQVVESYGLPSKLDSSQFDETELLELMRRDKKARNQIIFVLEGKDEMNPAVPAPEEAIIKALKQINK